jgi:hypothetical protein
MRIEGGERAHPVERVELLRPRGYPQSYGGAGGVSRLLVMLDAHVARRVYLGRDGVVHAFGIDNDGWTTPAQSVRDSDNSLQGVALRSASRRAIRRLVTHPDVVVENLAHQLRRYARAVVADVEMQEFILVLDLDINLRGDARRLAGIERVVYKFL